MKHYSNIGFDINNQKDEEDLFNDIYEDSDYPKLVWDVKNTDNKNILLSMQSIGEIRYFAKIDDDTHEIMALTTTHNNNNITKMNILGIYHNENTFPILQLEIEGYGTAFWFECPNEEIFDMDNEKGCDVKICSYPYSVSIEKPKESNTTAMTNLSNECYFVDTWDESYNPCKAIIRGVIKGYTVEKNIVTNKNYYAIDIECLGLHIKVLASTDLINENDIVIGDILAGKFWNTAILVADNHPEYF